MGEVPDPVATAPGPLRGRLLVAILVTLVVGVIAVTVGGSDRKQATVASTPTGTPASTSAPTSSPTVAAAPTATSTTPAAFPSSTCRPAKVASDSTLGIGIPRPARLATPGPEQSVFTAAVDCLQQVAGKAPVLRTQLPIDALRRTAPSDDEAAELTSFATLLVEHGSPGVVSIRAHDFAQCGTGQTPKAVEVGSLKAGAPLGRCQYPTPELYRQLFAEIAGALAKGAPGASLQYSAWNEPDHPDFTLRPALGQEGAATRAGQYWAQAATVVGTDHVFAGEFSDRDLPTLLALRTAFLRGTGGQQPLTWAIHPYRDLTTAPTNSTLDGFAKAVAPAPVWDTEVSPRLSGNDGLGANAGRQTARGAALRTSLKAGGRRVVLYLLTPPPPPQSSADDHWDSALADRAGRARPFVCGLAGLPKVDCAGDPATYG